MVEHPYYATGASTRIYGMFCGINNVNAHCEASQRPVGHPTMIRSPLGISACGRGLPNESPHTTEAEPEVCFIDTEACQARNLNSSHARMGEQRPTLRNQDFTDNSGRLAGSVDFAQLCPGQGPIIDLTERWTLRVINQSNATELIAIPTSTID